jgi:DNA polymerase-3 subunit gamma/tau
MSYQVIARKYRPQRFSDVVGQEHVTQTLANAIAQKRIAHAYLFCGPRGTGKTTVARIYAKCLNCTGGPRVDFDDADPRCQEITDGRSVDVLEIDGASNNGVEQVRELRETVKYMPASSKFKIFIIDEVHMLSAAAFNALLKTLEEPPEHVKFMFATTDPEKVLPTILSRCQRFDLRRIPTALIVKHLGQIAQQEHVRIDEPALLAIARGADGGMRDAESALDQLISFCGEGIEEPDVLSMFGLTSQAQVLEITRAVLAGQAEPALRQLAELARHGKDLGRLLADLLGHFRNLLLFKVSGGDVGLLEISETEAATLKAQSDAITAEALTRIMEVFSDTETRLRDAASKKILIEVALLKAIEARNAVSLDAVLQQLRQLREATGPIVTTTPAPAPATASAPGSLPASSAPPAAPAAKPPVAPMPVPKPAPAPVALAAPAAAVAPAVATPTPVAGPDLNALWSAVVEAAGRASPFTASYLKETHPVAFDGRTFTFGLEAEFADHLNLLDTAKAQTLLQTKLRELGHAQVQVKFIQAERPEGWVAPSAGASAKAEPPPAPAASAPGNGKAATKPAAKPAGTSLTKDDFKNDPLIKEALEIFKGRIVDVRG